MSIDFYPYGTEIVLYRFYNILSRISHQIDPWQVGNSKPADSKRHSSSLFWISTLSEHRPEYLGGSIAATKVATLRNNRLAHDSTLSGVADNPNESRGQGLEKGIPIDQQKFLAYRQLKRFSHSQLNSLEHRIPTYSSLSCVYDILHTHIRSSLERCCRSSRAVVVDIQPLAISAVPNTGLFWLCGAGPALAINVLCQADVRNAGSIFTNDMDVGVQDGGVYWLAVLRQYWQNTQTHQLHFTTKKEHPLTSSSFYILLTFHWILGYNKNCSSNFPGKSKQFFPLSPVLLLRNCALITA